MTEYRFFSESDETLIEKSKLPQADGIAVAVRTTGYESGRDEIVELSITDLSGAELFSRRVKPQNVETWQACAASGGIVPADVEDASELYQFEEEVSELFEGASIVVAQHIGHVESMIEGSWVTLPAYEGFDVVEQFRESHCTPDYPSEPATVATLESVAAYYGISCETGSSAAEAATIAACYRALVEEHAREREGKGAEYWRAYEERHAEENAAASRASAAAQMREHRLNQMNGLLWIAGAIIFTSLAIQLYQNGGNTGLIIMSIAAALFTASRGVVNFRK